MIVLMGENNNILDDPGFNVFSLDGEGYTCSIKEF
tara:strand:+ start:57 stop:161 length:105 start_codon:yes stop_codon:yes gene_type:complete